VILPALDARTLPTVSDVSERPHSFTMLPLVFWIAR
jgi:hypothetical protein